MVAVLDKGREFYVGIYPPTGDYEFLDNQPAIDGVVLNKNTTKADLDLDKVFQYRGQVASYDDLPTSGLHTGDTYNVADTGENYAWNGSGWDLLTGTEAVYWRNGALESLGSTLTIDSDKNPITNLILEDITDVTATKNEVNQLHNGTAVKNDFIKLHNITADANELNILDGATLTTTELNYVDGVTSSIQTQLNTLTTNLSNEISRATDAENTLQDNIDEEASTRATADTNEATARTNADNTLQSNIEAEASTRENADTTLDSKINTEVSRATTAEGTLQDNIDAEELRATTAENGKISKLSLLPASYENLNEIVQYVGESSNDYKTGYFYKYIGEPNVTFTPLGDYEIEVSISLADFKALMETKCEGRPFTAEDITHGQIGYYNAERLSLSASTDDGKFFHNTMTPAEFAEAGFTFNPEIGPSQGVKFTCNLTEINWRRIDVQPKPVTSVNRRTGDVLIDYSDVGAASAAQGALADTAVQPAALNDYYTKIEIDGKLTSAMHFKGTVATVDDLPDENQQVGDMYNVLDTGSNYAWDGTNWDKLSETIDLSPFTNHIANTNNPHEVTKAQVGLGNVDNTADLDKPISTATQEALDLKASNEALQAQVTALTKKINDLKLLIPQEVFDASTTRTAMNSSGKVTLCEDIDLGKLNIGAGIFASNDTSVNLNSHTIQSAPTGGRAMLLARGTAKYTFNGDGEFIDTADDSSAIWCASETSSITINNGTFISEAHTETIYCEKGTITINGGEFKTGAVDKTYLLNCKDANYQAGTANIIVKGGKFWDFDPHNNTAEGPNTNFCAEGYTTVSEEIDGHTVYTVVKE